MNLVARRKILDAFDDLNAVAFGGHREGPLGSSAPCACCGKRGEHSRTCEVGAAIAALVPLIPAYQDRERWLTGSIP
jgi:hypothetical protein